MATSKAFKNQVSSKRNPSAKMNTAAVGNAWLYGNPIGISHNSRLRQLIPKSAAAIKVVVLQINSNLDKIATGPLNDKASAAKSMFAKYRKHH